MITDDPPTPADVPAEPPPRTWRNDAADALRRMADEIDSGRGTAMLAVTISGTSVHHYQGCVDTWTGAMAVLWGLKLIDNLRARVEQQGIDQQLATLMARVQAQAAAEGTALESTEDGGHG